MKKLLFSYFVSPWAPALIVAAHAVLNSQDMETIFILTVGTAFIGYVILIIFGTPLLYLCLRKKFVRWYHVSFIGALSAAIPIALIAVYFPLGRGEAATTINNMVFFLPISIVFGSIAGLTYWFLGIYKNIKFKQT